MRVAVILPSRGLIFSETAEEIVNNLKNIPHKIFFSHAQPLPDCFEKPVNEALKQDFTHIWLVEDDMVLPHDILKKMLEMDKAVVTVNYPTTSRGDSSILSVGGRVVYAGTGCTLVKREVFDELKKPYFRSDIAWIPKNKGDYIKFTAVDKRDTDVYGLHDVNFFMNLYLLEIPVHVIEAKVGQRKLQSLGKSGSNDGAHKIKKWTKVKKDRYLTLKKNLPVEKSGNLTTVIANGNEVMLSQDHAQTLISKGMAFKPPHRPVVIDNTGVL